MLFYLCLSALLTTKILTFAGTLERLNKIVRNELSNFGWTRQKFSEKIFAHLRGENEIQKFINDLLTDESPILQLINLSIATSLANEKIVANSLEQQKSIETIVNYMRSVTNWARFEKHFLFGQEMSGSDQFFEPKIDWELAQRIRFHFSVEIGRLRNLGDERAIADGFGRIRQKLPKLIDLCQKIDRSLQLMVFFRLLMKMTSQDKNRMEMRRICHGTQQHNETLMDQHLAQLRNLFNTAEQNFGTEMSAIWNRENCGRKRMPIVCQILTEFRKLGEHWHEQFVQLYISSVCSVKLALGSTSQRRKSDTLPYRNAMF